MFFKFFNVFFIFVIKIEMPTVKDLKKLAKERGLRGYSKLRKAELLSLLEKPIPAPRTKRKDFSEKPIPAPRRDFSEKPIPAPRTKRKDFSEKPIPAPRRDFSEKPIPAPRTKRKDFSEKPIPAPRNIMNIRNPSINIPILQPEIAVVKESQTPSFTEKTIETFSDWMNWLAESGKNIVKKMPPKLKNLKEKINAIFEKEKKFEVKKGDLPSKTSLESTLLMEKLVKIHRLF